MADEITENVDEVVGVGTSDLSDDALAKFLANLLAHGIAQNVAPTKDGNVRRKYVKSGKYSKKNRHEQSLSKRGRGRPKRTSNVVENVTGNQRQFALNVAADAIRLIPSSSTAEKIRIPESSVEIKTPPKKKRMNFTMLNDERNALLNNEKNKEMSVGTFLRLLNHLPKEKVMARMDENKQRVFDRTMEQVYEASLTPINEPKSPRKCPSILSKPKVKTEDDVQVVFDSNKQSEWKTNLRIRPIAYQQPETTVDVETLKTLDLESIPKETHKPFCPKITNIQPLNLNDLILRTDGDIEEPKPQKKTIQLFPPKQPKKIVNLLPSKPQKSKTNGRRRGTINKGVTINFTANSTKSNKEALQRLRRASIAENQTTSQTQPQLPPPIRLKVLQPLHPIKSPTKRIEIVDLTDD
ncbi:hypothetical protein M3Y98_00710200 [Aphelenchoides besseyi]|nr:hypothetical protein M3Y98_00710200 [Aphelenchoides besseyi]KAI6210339.1 hypothetical protein M3Y96_00317800 [Aphelenchoides besseyi]